MVQDMKNDIMEMRRQGMTYQQIGEKIGLSRQRVQVIVAKELLYGEISLNDDLYFFVSNCFSNQEQGVAYIRRVYNALKKANINTVKDVATHKDKIEGVSARQWKKLWKYAVNNQ